MYLGKDRTAPEIIIKKEEISYTEGEDTTVLLTAVTAKDNIDGDLTDQVFVDRIIQTGKDAAVVYYGVMDQSYNVATARERLSIIRQKVLLRKMQTHLRRRRKRQKTLQKNGRRTGSRRDRG